MEGYPRASKLDVEVFDPASMTVSAGPSANAVAAQSCQRGVVFDDTIYAACNTKLVKLKEDKSTWELVNGDGNVYALHVRSRNFHDDLLVTDKICG